MLCKRYARKAEASVVFLCVKGICAANDINEYVKCYEIKKGEPDARSSLANGCDPLVAPLAQIYTFLVYLENLLSLYRVTFILLMLGF